MQVNYINPDWLWVRYTAKTLMSWTDEDINRMASSIQDADLENWKRYRDAWSTSEANRQNFRNLHPRSKLPSNLARKVKEPPDLDDRWHYLLKRRKLAFENAAGEKERDRRTFVERMSAGKVAAMLRRNRRIRQIINGEAERRGIELSERELDLRLKELFDNLN